MVTPAKPMSVAVETHGQQTTMRAVVNLAARTRGWTEPFDAPQLEDLPVITDPVELGAIYEQVMSTAHRDEHAAYYTPLPLAEVTTRLALTGVLDQVAKADDPDSVLRILAVDPACGAGIFLVLAVRRLAHRFAQLLSGDPDPAEWAVRYVMPEVATMCIFGMDIDPVAVDLAKSAVWLASDGRWMPDLLDRNIVVCDPLSGPNAQPPALAERLPVPVPAEDVDAGGTP